MLHLANRARVGYINEIIQPFFGGRVNRKEIKVVDVGCGGGLATECLARIGYSVTGLDVSPENIEVAKDHAGKDEAFANNPIEYLAVPVEEHISEREEYYDVAVCLEVIEHVDNLEGFVRDVCKLVKPGGILVFSTLNRTITSYIVTIILGEYVLGIIDKGTHSMDKFVKPFELNAMLNDSGCYQIDIVSLGYNPLSGSWFTCPPLICNEPLIGYAHASRKHPTGYRSGPCLSKDLGGCAEVPDQDISSN